MGILGYVLPAASIGFGALLIKPRRGFFPFNESGEALVPLIAQTTIEESHRDELHITEHPIEQGAAISDHAYKRPSEVIIKCGWSNSPSAAGGLIGAAVGVGAALGGPVARVLAALPSTIQAAQSLLNGNDQNQVKAIYEQLRALQTSRVPFDIYTGKTVYRNMLLQSLTTETNEHTENSLIVVAHCREVLIVATRVISVPPSDQASPEKTNPVQDFGARSLTTPPNFQVPNIPSVVSKFGSSINNFLP